MPRKPRKPAPPARVSETKVSKTYRLSPRKIVTAQELLGAPTATAAIEQALDMVVFRRELIDGARAIGGVQIEEAFPDDAR
jgi:hypothetical protein